MRLMPVKASALAAANISMLKKETRAQDGHAFRRADRDAPSRPFMERSK
jgi:hypothetical protein